MQKVAFAAVLLVQLVHAQTSASINGYALQERQTLSVFCNRRSKKQPKSPKYGSLLACHDQTVGAAKRPEAADLFA